MKISINLIPQDAKNAIRRTLRVRMIFVYGVTLLLIPLAVMSVLGLLLVATNLERSGLHTTEMEIRAQSDMQAMEADDHLIAQTNRAVRTAQKMDRYQNTPSATLRALSAIMPEALRIEKVTIERKFVTIRGVAMERDRVLQLKRAMEASACFDNITLPLTSLIDRRNTDFAITAVITPCQ